MYTIAAQKTEWPMKDDMECNRFCNYSFNPDDGLFCLETDLLAAAAAACQNMKSHVDKLQFISRCQFDLDHLKLSHVT